MEKVTNIQTSIRDLIPAGDTEVVEIGQHILKRKITIKDGAILKILDQGKLLIED